MSSPELDDRSAVGGDRLAQRQRSIELLLDPLGASLERVEPRRQLACDPGDRADVVERAPGKPGRELERAA